MQNNPLTAEQMEAIFVSLRQHFGDRKTVFPQILTHGYANVVLVLAEDQLVLRVPRSAEAQQRQQLEATLLKALEHLPLGCAIPHVKVLSNNPAYMACTYIPGVTVAREEMLLWPEAKRLELGNQLGAALYRLHSQAHPEQFFSLLGERPSLLEQFRVDIFNPQQATPEPLKSIAQDEFNKLASVEHAEQPLLVLHGDIHAANMVLNKQHQLVGLLDFADMHLGSVYQELRRVYMLDLEVLQACIKTYQHLSGKVLEYDLIRQWAVVHELSVLCRHAHEPEYASLPRARAHLKEWLGVDFE